MERKSSWPSDGEVNKIRKIVSEMAGRCIEEVRVVVSPYRICPLGAHIDHQGGTVLAMTVDRGILLGFVPSGNAEVVLRSGQFQGEVRFRVDEIQHPRRAPKTNEDIQTKLKDNGEWGRYARGALYALQQMEYNLSQGIVGYICGSDDMDSSGLSSSAAVGIAYLLALENANNINISNKDNISCDRLIENGYLGLRNGILDQSAILLSSSGCLMCMDCNTKTHKLVYPPKLQNDSGNGSENNFKILLAFSGLKQALYDNPGYNSRVDDCQGAAKVLLEASGKGDEEPLLCNVEQEVYEAHKNKLNDKQAKRTEHYFSESMRVMQGLKAWESGKLEEFGKLISASGVSSIRNYECGAKPLVDLYEILLKAPGVYGARFSGAGFRGCCVALVDPDRAEEAASFVRSEYKKCQPDWASKTNQHSSVVICQSGGCAHVIPAQV